jgi:hypothetical protein
MNALTWFAIVSWTLLTSVMFGGYSLLRLLQKNKLSPEQIVLFRAGHAHAGVLLAVSLIYYQYMRVTSLLPGTRFAASAALLTGIVLQSGGFFWRAFVDKEDKALGSRLTVTGATLLAISVFVLVYGLVLAA